MVEEMCGTYVQCTKKRKEHTKGYGTLSVERNIHNIFTNTKNQNQRQGTLDFMLQGLSCIPEISSTYTRAERRITASETNNVLLF